MASLRKWNPSGALEKFRYELDDLLERFGSERGWLKEWEPIRLRPAVESYVDDDKFTVRVDLPGIDPSNVDIKVGNGIITIKGSREEKPETKNPDYFRRGIHYGSFERSISLPEGMKAADLKATYCDGVLELNATMPKKAVPNKVEVQIGGVEAKKVNDDKRAA
jgi:HSP20 family protein